MFREKSQFPHKLELRFTILMQQLSRKNGAIKNDFWKKTSPQEHPGEVSLDNPLGECSIEPPGEKFCHGEGILSFAVHNGEPPHHRIKSLEEFFLKNLSWGLLHVVVQNGEHHLEKLLAGDFLRVLVQNRGFERTSTGFL